jgi:ubiquitin conjugation factor E4 B
MYTTPLSLRYAEAFALNFEAVMIKLANSARAQYASIDPLVPHLSGSLTPFTPEQGTLGDVDPSEDDEWQALLARADGSLTRVSQVFFVAAYCLECCTSGLLRLREQVAERRERLRRAFSTLDPDVQVVAQHTIRALHINSLALDGHLIRPHKVKDFAVFAHLTLQWLLHVGQIIDGELPEKALLTYARLPEYVLGAVMSCFTIVPIDQISEPTELLHNFALIFANKHYVRSPIVQARIVRFFSAVAKDGRTRYLVCGLPRVIELMFPRVLEFYASIQVTGTNATNIDRFQYRGIASDLLIAWLSIADLQTFFRNRVDDPIYSNFVYYLVDDSLTLADRSFTNLTRITAALRDGDDGPDGLAELQTARGDLGYLVQAVDKGFQLMRAIALFASNVFHECTVLDSLTKLLLCYMDAFVKHEEYFRAENFGDVAFDPKALLTSLLRIANTVAEDVKIVDRLVCNEMYPPEGLARPLHQLAEREGVDSDVVRRFEVFIQTVIERTAVAEAEKVDTSDAPDEFIDEITSELMQDPMKLPSGHFMDREAIKKMLLTRPIDPWTTIPFTIEECVPAVELKQKIEEYLAQKRAEGNK